MGQEQFFTQDVANDGLKLPLFDPATNKKTEHWLNILGVDSDVYRTAKAEANRRAVAIAAIDDVALREAAFAELERWAIAHLVSAWSFAEECTVDAVAAFMKKAPQIQDTVDRVAGKRALFFASRSIGSSNSPEPSSTLTDDQKDQSKASEPA